MLTISIQIWQYWQMVKSWQNANTGLERPIHTYEQREQSTITAWKKYFTLGGCTGHERPIHTYKQKEQSTITDLKKYFTLGGCLVLKG